MLKLYSVNKLLTDKPSHCLFQNFSNHPMANYRSSCSAVITKQVPTNQEIIYRPVLIFPIVNIKRQLQRLYNKKGFEESCRKWATRQIYMMEEFGKNFKIQMKTDCSSGMTY